MNDKEHAKKKEQTTEDPSALFKDLYPNLSDEEATQKYNQWVEDARKASVFEEFLVDKELAEDFKSVEKDLENRRELRKGVWESKRETQKKNSASLNAQRDVLVKSNARMGDFLQLETIKALHSMRYVHDLNFLRREEFFDRQYRNDLVVQAAMIKTSRAIEKKTLPWRALFFVTVGGGAVGGVVGAVASALLRKWFDL